MQDGYFYDLGLSSDYAIHYVIKNGVLDRIITVYENISVEQLRNRFDKLYGEKHIDEYFFSDDYKSYKTIISNNHGLATVVEEATYNTRFTPEIAGFLYNIGISNKYPISNKKGISKNSNSKKNIEGKNTINKPLNNSGNSQDLYSTTAKNRSTLSIKQIQKIDSTNAIVKKLEGTKETLNLQDMIDIIKHKQLSSTELKDFIQSASSRNWNMSIDDNLISFAWNVDASEFMQYDTHNHTFLIESNDDDKANAIIKELEVEKYKKTICKLESGQIYKVRFSNGIYSVLCRKDQGGSMGNTPTDIIISMVKK